MKRSDIAILTSAVGLVTGLVGFGIGHATAGKTTATATANGGQGAAGSGYGSSGGADGARRFGGRPVFGTVASLSGSTLAITDTGGTTHTVTLSANTTYSSGANAAATQADLTAGTSVAAFGQTAADGTITATRVIINPSMPSGGGAAAPGAGAAD